MLHIPLLRAGQIYHSLSKVELPHSQTQEPMAIVSQANPGLIARDFMSMSKNQRTLDSFSVHDLIRICQRAGQYFIYDDLPIGDQSQSPSGYIDQLSASTGVPKTLCGKNMNKIFTVLDQMEDVLGGLTRGLDLAILDRGSGQQHGRTLGYICTTHSLGAVLPSNSAGVHSLWLPSIPLKVPMVLKPGSAEPWTPYRVAQALIKAGCPSEAFSFYPTDHSGATELLLRSGKAMLYGGQSTVAPWESDPRIQIHGPGWSKILIGEDAIEDWENYLDLLVASTTENSGRSCINASGIWLSSNGQRVAEALADRFSQIDALPLDHPQAKLAAFTNPVVAHQLSEMIDNQLKIEGAIDLTSEIFGIDRIVEIDGYTFMLPMVVYCTDPEHPLANTEFLFPFVSVVETPQSQILDQIESTLVATAITNDEAFIADLLHCTDIERLNIGQIPTNKISWDQPHEGNLFELLYRQRAFQRSTSPLESQQPIVASV